MMPLDNRHIEGMEEPIDQPFSNSFVDQVERARNSVCDDICQELGVRDGEQDSLYQDIRACNMTKRSVTKEKLCDWLETVCCILNSYAVPSNVPISSKKRRSLIRKRLSIFRRK